MKTLYLIRGVPGSGKSTFARKLKSTGLVDHVVEADDYFIRNGIYNFDPTKIHNAHGYCQECAKAWLVLGHSVAVSNTSTTEKEVAVYAKIAEGTGAQFVSIIVENRHGGINQHNVPPEKIEQMKRRFSVKL